MGKKSTPAAPAAPDPVATANAQAQANTQAAITQANLNRIDQYTPQGSLTYQQNGTNADGTPKYSQTQTYSPEQQALYNQQNQIAQSLGGLAQDNVTRVQQAQSQPFNFDGMTPLQTNVQAGGLQYGTANPQAQTSVAPAGGIQSSFGTAGPLTSNVQAGGIQNQIQGAGPVQSNVQAGQVQNSLNFGSQYNPGDYNQTSQAAADAAYKSAASRLDPQFAQQESDMRTRLANAGIAENSDAYRREMDNFARSRTDAYGQAQNTAFSQGLAAQNQGYNQSLGTRQQQVGETTTQGNFANAAQNQQFQQGQQNAALNNSAQGQVFGQNAQQLQAYNSAQAQQFAQGTSNAQLNNAAQGQQFNQNAQSAAFGNAAQDQQYQQNLASAGFNNAAISQNFNQAQQNAQLNNTTQNQAFNQAGANAQLNNAGRQQQIQEASYLRNLPLNDIAALLGTGGGVQNPTFQNVSQVGVAAPDYQGAVYANYNAANQQYQAAQQAKSQGLGSIFGLAGSLGSAAIMSDARLKRNVKRIGTLANGLATYTYNYLWSAAQEFGVMAQEVMGVVPDAIVHTPSGYMAVDYRKVW